jgi:7-cyano-7-deazaguanine synthase
MIDKTMTARSTDSSATGRTVAVLASGGMDSCILLSHMVRRGHPVQPIYVRCGLIWEPEESAALQQFVRCLAEPGLLAPATLELPVADLYGAHWSITANGTPERNSSDEAVLLPGRNLLLATKAAVWCQLHAIDELALATLGTSPFADAKPAFFARLEELLACGGDLVHVWAPFAALDKSQVMQLGTDLPLELTFSCLAPVAGQHCGRCNKCAERQAAFRGARRPDPTRYA